MRSKISVVRNCTNFIEDLPQVLFSQLHYMKGVIAAGDSLVCIFLVFKTWMRLLFERCGCVTQDLLSDCVYGGFRIFVLVVVRVGNSIFAACIVGLLGLVFDCSYGFLLLFKLRHLTAFFIC